MTLMQTRRRFLATLSLAGAVGLRAPRVQFLRLRRKAEECVDLAVGEQLDRLYIRAGGNPVDVFDWVEPDMGSHRGKEYMRAGSQALYADTLAL